MDLERSDLILLLEKQEKCDVIFVLRNNVEVKAHSYVLSILSARFYRFNRNSLVFIMDKRIEERAMWNFMRFMYARKTFEIDEQNKDSYIILAYFFDVQEMIRKVDQYMFRTMTELTAFDRLLQVIALDMSYNIKVRIYDYIKRNVMMLPPKVSLDSVLLQPKILTTAQKAHKNYMDFITKSENDLMPFIEVGSDVFKIIIDNSPRVVIKKNDIKVTIQELMDSDVELIDIDLEMIDSDAELVDSNEELVDSDEELVDSNEELVDSDEELIDPDEELIDSDE